MPDALTDGIGVAGRLCFIDPGPGSRGSPRPDLVVVRAVARPRAVAVQGHNELHERAHNFAFIVLFIEELEPLAFSKLGAE
jgi:hypothetical protein